MADTSSTKVKASRMILLLGTGAFAARIAFDLAATAQRPVAVTIAGRNAARLDWLRTAANARAAIFGSPARFTTARSDLMQPGAPDELIASLRPAVVVQAASAQTSSVISAGDGWARLVAQGGLSATAVFQAVLSARVARAVQRAGDAATQLVNCCFPDVVNGMLAALGLPVACGTGNVAILANAFAGAAPEAGRARVLAHYQTLAPWRLAGPRQGVAPRVWLGDAEVADVFERFRDVQITPEPAIEISGAAGVPLILAMAQGHGWAGHVPGPSGLPGGYPVRWRDGALSLDLPSGLSREAAIGWNARFEAASGLVIDGGRARYTGRLHDLLRAASPDLASGFELADLEQVYEAMLGLRGRLQESRC